MERQGGTESSGEHAVHVVVQGKECVMHALRGLRYRMAEIEGTAGYTNASADFILVGLLSWRMTSHTCKLNQLDMSTVGWASNSTGFFSSISSCTGAQQRWGSWLSF